MMMAIEKHDHHEVELKAALHGTKMSNRYMPPIAIDDDSDKIKKENLEDFFSSAKQDLNGKPQQQHQETDN